MQRAEGLMKMTVRLAFPLMLIALAFWLSIHGQ
jgi:hypothetical protein